MGLSASPPLRTEAPERTRNWIQPRGRQPRPTNSSVRPGGQNTRTGQMVLGADGSSGIWSFSCWPQISDPSKHPRAPEPTETCHRLAPAGSRPGPQALLSRAAPAQACTSALAGGRDEHAGVHALGVLTVSSGRKQCAQVIRAECDKCDN